MIHVAGAIRRHLESILSYLVHRITNAVTEGLNIAFLASRGAIPNLIVVGIGNGKDRTHDLTPAARGKTAKDFPTAGGAESMTSFIVDEVLPRVRSEYRTLPTTVLAGHYSLARRTVWTYYESMAIPRIKATYSLDIDTMRVLERAAKRWGVSKSEALRRAVRAIATTGGPEPEATLDELQAAAGIATASANRWIRDLRTERQADRARPPKRSR